MDIGQLKTMNRVVQLQTACLISLRGPHLIPNGLLVLVGITAYKDSLSIKWE